MVFDPSERGEAARRPRVPAALLAACLIAFACVEARAARRPRAPLGLVPAGSVAVLRLDWHAVRADRSLREAVKAGELERIFARVGVLSDEVSEAVIFLDLADLNRAGVAMILRGPRLRPAFDELRSLGWAAGEFRGYRVHSDGAGDASLAQLRPGLIVTGARHTVERVIEVESRGAPDITADAKFRRLSAHTSAAHPVSLLMVMSQEYADAADVLALAASMLLDFAGLGPLGTLLDNVGLARGVGFAFGRRGDTLAVSLIALMRDERAAGLVSGTLTLLKGAATLRPARRTREAEDGARRVFQGMTVARTREVVSVKFALPESVMTRR